MSTWYRDCYRFPHWTMKIGWDDGFARGHWSDDKAAIERSVAAVQARGGEAFVETMELKEGHCR